MFSLSRFLMAVTILIKRNIPKYPKRVQWKVSSKIQPFCQFFFFLNIHHASTCAQSLSSKEIFHFPFPPSTYNFIFPDKFSSMRHVLRERMRFYTLSTLKNVLAYWTSFLRFTMVRYCMYVPFDILNRISFAVNELEITKNI